MNKTPLTWGDLVESANNHAVEYDCEVVLDGDRAGDAVQIGAAPVRLSLRSDSLDGGDETYETATVLASQVAVVESTPILKIEDQDTGSFSLIGARGVDLFRVLYV